MRDIKIAFVGDSFVNGVGDPKYLGWVGRVCQSTQKNNPRLEITAYNLGIRRETSTDVLQRWQYEVNSRLINCDQSIIVFSFGVNDCVIIDDRQRVDIQTSTYNLQTILLQAKNIYDDIVFVMSPPIADDTINLKIEQLICSYEEVCTKLGIAYIDIFKVLQANELWRQQIKDNDGAHPRAQGYDLFANLILEDKNWKALWK